MTSKPPNIILIVLDTVGAKHLSLYGYPRRTTPNLEEIAGECMVYPRCFATSNWTMPSHASMFTGLYPSQHGVYEGNLTLWDNVHHLASILKMAGYQTLGVSANGLVAPASGLCPDFDYFKDLGFGLFDQFLDRMQHKPMESSRELWIELTRKLSVRHFCQASLQHFSKNGGIGELIRLVQWVAKSSLQSVLNPTPIDKSSGLTKDTVKIFNEIFDTNIVQNDHPFFIFINFIEAHQRYRPPLRYRKFSHWYDKQLLSSLRCYKTENSPAKENFIRKYLNLYDDEIYFLDHIIRQLWDIFKNTKYFDETLIIITSDHGEHLGEKEHYGHYLSLYNELIWVPLVVKFPREYGKKGEDQRLVSLTDFYSTILDLIGSPMPRPWTSLSLLDGQTRELALAQLVLPEQFKAQLEAKRNLCRKTGVDYYPHILAVITKNGYKIIEDRPGNLEVYNLNSNMSENHNLAPHLTPEALGAYHELLEDIKIETNYYEAVEDGVTRTGLEGILSNNN